MQRDSNHPAQPRRILFMSSNLGWGGSEILWSQTAAALAQAGHKVGVRVLYRDAPGGPLRHLTEQGCYVQEGWFADSLPNAQSSFIAAATAWLTRIVDNLRFRWFFWRFGTPDLAVISQGGNHDGYQMTQSFQGGWAPYVLLVSKATEMYWPVDGALPGIRLAYALAACNYFVSEHNWRLTEEQLGMRLANAAVVRNPFKVLKPAPTH